MILSFLYCWKLENISRYYFWQTWNLFENWKSNERCQKWHVHETMLDTSHTISHYRWIESTQIWAQYRGSGCLLHQIYDIQKIQIERLRDFTLNHERAKKRMFIFFVGNNWQKLNVLICLFNVFHSVFDLK